MDGIPASFAETTPRIFEARVHLDVTVRCINGGKKCRIDVLRKVIEPFWFTDLVFRCREPLGNGSAENSANLPHRRLA
jgi:hypothetical protein